MNPYYQHTPQKWWSEELPALPPEVVDSIKLVPDITTVNSRVHPDARSTV